MLRRALLGKSAHPALVVAALLLVLWFFHWTVQTAGGFQTPGEEDYYNFLVRGWRQGQLHLSKEPSPALLALADPYDPVQNGAVRMGDASYFEGHYYLYFGAAPAAVLLLPYGLLTGRELASTTAIFIFCTVGFSAATGVWLALRRRYFPASAGWVAPAGVLLLGLGTHVLALQRRPLVWELPIATGYAFSMLALGGIYAALHGRRHVALALALAGLGFGLATAARPTCLLGAIAFVPALIHLAARETGPRHRGVRWSLAAGVPLGICLLAVLAHNAARFGQPLEFGQNYQLSGVYESRVRHFSPRYLAQNLDAYFFHPGIWTAKFPFVEARPVQGGPAGYGRGLSEGVCGLAVTFPFVWFALAVPLGWCQRGLDEKHALQAMTGAIAGVGLGPGLAMCSYFLSTPRYMADFAPALALLALGGWLGLERSAAEKKGRGLLAAVMLALGLWTAGAGVLLSFDYQGRLLSRTWPQGWARLEQFFAFTSR